MPLGPVVIVIALVVLALIAYGGYSCVRAPSSSTFTDSISHFPPGSVTYLASGRTYLVRQANGAFLALSDAEANEADRISGCLIRYRPDLSASGETGIFRDDCHGTLFNRAGVAVQGNSSPMEHHPVTVSGGTVTVRFKQCLAGNAAQPEPCRM